MRDWLRQADIDEGKRDGITSAEREQLQRENVRLRRENKVLREEREILSLRCNSANPCLGVAVRRGW